jgi:excisionase family DNA binding protein
MPDENTVTVRDIAVLLKKSEDWVYRHARSKDIPGFRVGREWRFFASKVVNHLEQPRDTWALPSRRGRRAA